MKRTTVSNNLRRVLEMAERIYGYQKKEITTVRYQRTGMGSPLARYDVCIEGKWEQGAKEFNGMNIYGKLDQLIACGFTADTNGQEIILCAVGTKTTIERQNREIAALKSRIAELEAKYEQKN